MSVIDRDKLRVFAQKLEGECLLQLLGRAIDLVPESALPALVEGFAHPEDLLADGTPPASLLEAVRRFCDDSERGEYYESFVVNSGNFTDKSRGTQRWIAECHRLFERCVGEADTGSLSETRSAFESLFGLLSRLDHYGAGILFFAHDHGSQVIGIHWPGVLPAWFRCLATTANAEIYATAVHNVIAYFAHHAWDSLLSEANRAANEEQRAALSKIRSPGRSFTLFLPS